MLLFFAKDYFCRFYCIHRTEGITFNKAIIDIRLRPRCAILYILLNLSPINAKITSLSCIYQYIFVSSAMYTVTIVTMTMA